MGKRKYIEEKEDGEYHQPKQAKDDKILPETSDEKNLSVGNNVFDVKYFRKDLSSKIGQTIALTQFLQVCTNAEAETDYLLEYLNSGGNAHEVLRQIGADNKKNLTLATPAFNLFQLIVMKVKSELPQLVSITEEACRYFLNTFIPTVEIMIGEHSGQKHRLIILQLLTSMVALNPELGIEVLNQVPLTPKHLQYLTEKKKEGHSVRTACIHLITSFLYDGHAPLIKAFLEKQGLLSLVLPELVYEDGESVIIFLDIVEKHIVNNQHISKSLKLRTFSHQVIHNMFRVFNWKGPANLANETRQSLQMSITETLRRILLTLFTSNKNGLYFLDDKLGTGDFIKNPNLCKALESLKRPWENENVCDLILSILDECPDLYRSAISVVEQSFDPQHSVIWKKTVDFTIKLICNVDQEKLVKKCNHLNPTQVTNFIRFTSLPIPLLKYIYQSTSINDIALTNQCILVLVQMLLSIKSYLNSLKDSHEHTISLVKHRLETFLPKHLPAAETLVRILQNLQLGKLDLKVNSNDYRLPVPHVTRSMINLLDVLLLYCELQPALLENVIGDINVKEMLYFCDKLKDGDVLQLKFKIASLLLHFDKYAIATEKSLFKDITIIMLDVYIKGDVKSAREAKSVLSSFLKSTKIFEGDEEEIDIILYILKVMKASNLSELIVQILENSLANISELKVKINKTYSEGVTNLDDNIDKLLSILKSMQSKQDFAGHESNIAQNMHSTYITITPFLLESLKLFSQLNNTNGDFVKFVQLHIVHFVHYNLSPELMCKTLSTYKLDVKAYIKAWTKKPAHLNTSIFPEESFLYKIDCVLISSDDCVLENIFPVVVRETNTFSLENNFKFEDDYEIVIWANLIRYHLTQLLKLKALDKKKFNIIKKLFDFVVKFSKSACNEVTCRKIISKTLASAVLLSLFSFDVCEEGKATLRDFLVHFIPLCYEVCGSNYVDNMCKPYRHKIFIQLQNELIKMNEENTNYSSKRFDEVVSIIQLELKESFEIMLTICDMKVSCLFTEKNEPALPLYVATKILENFKTTIQNIPDNVTSHILKLYIKMLETCTSNHNFVAFEESLLNFLETYPANIFLVTEHEFQSIFKLKVIKKTTSQIFAMFLKYNTEFISTFIKNITTPNILARREIALPLANAACCHDHFVTDNTPILFAFYREYNSNISKILEKPQKVGVIYENNWKFISTLILECMDISDCERFFNKIHKFESLENFHYNLMHVAFLKAIYLSKSNKKEYLINYILILLNMLSSNLQSDYMKVDALIDIIHIIDEVLAVGESLNILNEHQTDGIKKIIDNSTWQNFCKAVLKSSLRVSTIDEVDEKCHSLGPILLNLMTNLIILIYPENHQELATLFEMATSHSEFLNVMLSNHSKDVKYQLLKLLYVLLMQNKSVMKSQHISVYLSSYHASQSKSDRLIFKILHLYHLNGQPMHEFKPYLWGDAAANFYSVRKKRSKSLWGHPTPNQIINLFDKEVIETTVKLFPIFQKLSFESESYVDLYEPLAGSKNSTFEIFNEISEVGVFNSKPTTDNLDLKISKEEEFRREMLLIKCKKILDSKFHGDMKNRNQRLECIDDLDIYDPSFVLPLLSHILAPGNIVSCFKVVRSGLLAIPIMALSSSCSNMRAAGYHVLHRFHLQLETETRHKNDKLLLNDFFETLKKSLASTTKPSPNTGPGNPRLPSIITTYLSRALMVLTAPFHPLYKPVNNFLIAKDRVDFTFVPDFLSLFHDNDVEFVNRRLWILEVMSDGLKSANDASLLFKSMSLKLVLSMYLTVLSDKKTKESILKLLCSIFALPRPTEILLSSYSVLPWMAHVFSKFEHNDSNLVSIAIKLLSNVWYSNTINQINQSLTRWKGDISSISFSEIKKLRPINNIDVKMYSLIENLLPNLHGLPASDINCYLNLLCKFPIYRLKQLSDNYLRTLIKLCFRLFQNEELERILLRNIIMKNKVELVTLCESFNLNENKNKDNVDDVVKIYYLVKVFIKLCN